MVVVEAWSGDAIGIRAKLVMPGKSDVGLQRRDIAGSFDVLWVLGWPKFADAEGV